MKKWIVALALMALAASLSAQNKPAPKQPPVAAKRGDAAKPANVAKPAGVVKSRRPAVAHARKAARAKSARVVKKRAVAASGRDGRRPHARGVRDPFISPIVERRVTAAPCEGGVRCISSGELILQGVVTSSDGDIAMIDNGHGKVYFLRVNDPVLNGVVARITPSSIVIREHVIDRWGKPKTVEVVRRLMQTE